MSIKYKNRKSSCIYLDRYGNLEVQAPKGTNVESVIRLLEENWNGILKKSKEKKERLDGQQVKSYQHGEPFLYHGKSFPIDILHDPGHH